MLYEVLLVAYLIVALLLIGFVLIQQGKGADMGASFGAGGSNTVFGSSGSGNFMTRTTAILATLFFFISLTIGSMTANTDKEVDSFQNIDIPVQDVQPAEPLPMSDIPNVGTPVDELETSDVPATEDEPESSDEPN
ncbi:preprotein translocase subunit SecG [Ningiella sp. W23]|uniref:preprotein translocase subunit SecG n=1 Tax=Ningiella sp. W23 TaxID=3023715 RepID=UPI003757CDEE